MNSDRHLPFHFLQHQYSPKRIISLTTFLLDAPLRYVMSLQIHTGSKPIDIEDEVKADLTQLTRGEIILFMLDGHEAMTTDDRSFHLLDYGKRQPGDESGQK